MLTPIVYTLIESTGNRQPATGNRQPATGNRQPATGNRQPESLVPLESARQHSRRLFDGSSAAARVEDNSLDVPVQHDKAVHLRFDLVV